MFTVNNLWLLVATALVFVMHLGFACLELGLTRARNTVNILFKNIAIVSLGLLTYALVGFSLMYPGEEFAGAWFGFDGFGIGPDDGYEPIAYADGAYTYWSDFIFQGMFAATAATIVSGAVAERIKIESFLIFSLVFVAVVYPVVGMWHWGGGWLNTFGGGGDNAFHDFAGSTIVHSVGGWGALAGALVLGPRLGKYIRTAGGAWQSKALMGHSMPFAAVGMFLLWFGWFGFNGGSVLSADASGVSYVFVTTALAGAAGIAGAMVATWTIQAKPDLTMIMNGALAGLVGITAGADVIGVPQAVIVGAIAGVLVVLSVLLFDRLRVDDPVGAISVHLVCGVWGTLAVGLFAPGKSIVAQLAGIGATAALCLPAALVLFLGLKHTLGLRVSQADEMQGLDISEHGMEAYSGFQFFTTQ
ncbi:MAG: ammonium transporter [Planctomycetota bacterium]